jgi:hypothetical protein
VLHVVRGMKRLLLRRRGCVLLPVRAACKKLLPVRVVMLSLHAVFR